MTTIYELRKEFVESLLSACRTYSSSRNKLLTENKLLELSDQVFYSCTDELYRNIIYVLEKIDVPVRTFIN